MTNEDIIYGRNAVLEALNGGHKINRLLIVEGKKEGTIQKIISLAKDKGMIFEFVSRERLDKLTDKQNHQGVVAYISPIEYSTLEEILNSAENPFILLLDELEDPHNFGAILRTAEAFGVNGVLIPKRRSVSLNATVMKTSAGAAEYIKVAQITNVAQTIKELKENFFTIIGSDIEGENIFTTNKSFKSNESIVLIVGNEGKGMRRLTKENCDVLLKIPMQGKINSFNASVATGILIYEIIRQRKQF